MIAFGVPAGAITPAQLTSSIPERPASANVGTSGSTIDRLGAVTARPRTLPDLMTRTASREGMNMICIRPASRSVARASCPTRA